MSHKQIKIKFVDFWKGFDPIKDHFLLYKLLCERYDVVICDDADYVFYSYSGDYHWGVPDKCVKIFFTGENLAPDFGACDYAIGFEHLTYEDRYIRFPLWLFYGDDLLHKMTTKHILPEDWDISKEKPEFCSFVVSNPRGKERNEAFALLSNYKKVDSGGGYMNNIPEGRIHDKFSFDCKHKFSLCYENSRHNGYTTEKIVQALAARTIPIYWGDPRIEETFNPNAFINVSSYNSFNEVVEVVKELDSDNEAYLKYLRTPALQANALTVEEEYQRLKNWLYPIFDRSLDESFRRNRVMIGREYIEKHILWNKRVHRESAREILLNQYKRKIHNRINKMRKRIGL